MDDHNIHKFNICIRIFAVVGIFGSMGLAYLVPFHPLGKILTFVGGVFFTYLIGQGLLCFSDAAQSVIDMRNKYVDGDENEDDLTDEKKSDNV